MSELLSVEITKSQLDSWTAESKEKSPVSFAYSSAFARQPGNVDIFRTAVEMVGCYLLKGRRPAHRAWADREAKGGNCKEGTAYQADFGTIRDKERALGRTHPTLPEGLQKRKGE